MNEGHGRRATSLGPPERYLLEQWASSVRAAFPDAPGLFLVGSVARAEPWRDVDVRLMLDDEEFAALTGASPTRLQGLNVAFSLWGQRATGLPVDFQFQDTSEANRQHDGIRNAIGCPARSGNA